jgi:hypothetical protein
VLGDDAVQRPSQVFGRCLLRRILVLRLPGQLPAVVRFAAALLQLGRALLGFLLRVERLLLRLLGLLGNRRGLIDKLELGVR